MIAFNSDRSPQLQLSLLAICDCWEIYKNIFKSVASISAKCVIMVYCGDSESVGLSFHFFFLYVSICSELVIVSGVKDNVKPVHQVVPLLLGTVGWVPIITMTL